MPPPLLQNVTTAGLPQYCEPSSPFLHDISSWLTICLPTPLALLSSLLGTLSIVSWLFAQLPQIYKNYQVQSTMGLSLFFLVIWCLGDSSNFIGAVLTRQAGWQKVIAAYYVFVDVVLVFQYFWYTHVKARRGSYHGSDVSHEGGVFGSVLEGVSLFEHDIAGDTPGADTTQTSEPVDVKIGQGVNASLAMSPPLPDEKHSSPRRSITRTGRGGPSPLLAPTRIVLLTSMLFAVLTNATSTGQPHIRPPVSNNPHETTTKIVGRIFSWMSTLLYLGSRPPQLYKNYRRQSTTGLSPLLFMAAFCGNLFYSTSILTNPDAWYDFPPHGGGGWAGAHGNNRLEWIGRTIPFFLGAFGVLGMDGLMGLQFLMYGPAAEEVAVAKDKGNDNDRSPGESRWTHVRVWVSHWVPWVSPTSRRISIASSTTVPEGQALLGHEPVRYGAL